MAGFHEAIDLILRSHATLGQIFIINAINFVSEDMKKKIFVTDNQKEYYLNVTKGSIK